MIRWLLFIPFIETYMDERKNNLLSKFLLKRNMYCLENTKSFYIHKQVQLTALSYQDKNKKDLIHKLKSNYRNEIKSFEKKISKEQVKLSRLTNLNKMIIEFLLNNFRGQKPNINKLNRLSIKKSLLIFIIFCKDQILCCQVWIRKKNRARLIYNVADYKIMQNNKMQSANKYLMFSTILNLNNSNFDIIDLGGISGENNNIDKFKNQFSRKKTLSYNIISF